MKRILLISLIITTPFAGAWGGCCGPSCDHQEEATFQHEEHTPHKNCTCPDCRPDREDKSYPAGCATCSAYGKKERQCGVCGQDTVQARCPQCPIEK